MHETLQEDTFDSAYIRISSSGRFKQIITYGSLLLFVVLVIFVSVAVNKFVIDTISVNLDTIEPDAQESNASKDITIKKGDTLRALLFEQNVVKEEIEKIMKLVRDGKLSPSLKVGQKVSFKYDTVVSTQEVEESVSLNRIIIEINPFRSLQIVREGDNFTVQDVTIPLNQELHRSSVVITFNFMSALKSLGLSGNSIAELIGAYAYQIDFQRQIKTGDTVSIIAEKFVTEDGKFAHYGRVLYVSLNSSGKEYNIYRYSPTNSSDNQVFFSEDGKSAKRSLLRTPLKMVKISSRYGVRNHPTLGYTKMHKGVDFAAPTGTPIYSAGSGVITEIGWKSGYGNFIQIKHSATLSTAYAHASSFNKNLKVGSIVKQGDVIALVGMTGRTTGPHLHYEVKINGQNVDPMSVKTTPVVELTGKQLARFTKFKQEIKNLGSTIDSKNVAPILN